jgi:hypothetical protein
VDQRELNEISDYFRIENSGNHPGWRKLRQAPDQQKMGNLA